MKRQPSKWEKTIASETTDKELISKIYKQLNTRKINDLIKKWALGWESGWNTLGICNHLVYCSSLKMSVQIYQKIVKIVVSGY